MNNPECPLCGSMSGKIRSHFDVAVLKRRWLEEMRIDVAPDMSGIDDLIEIFCSKCGLSFFDPRPFGSPAFYAQLQDIYDWYYQDAKWEHIKAVNLIRDNVSVLEIGSGTGAFLKRLREARPYTSAVGIETNLLAAELAQHWADKIVSTPLKTFLREANSIRYHWVCAFQVLEHIPEPAIFLAQCIEALEHGGKLLLSVPNNRSFIRHEKNNLLNLPPHHATRWDARSLRSMTKVFPELSLKGIFYEPLADYHNQWFINVQLERVPKIPYLTWPLISVARSRIFPWLKARGALRHVRGHTVMGLFVKENC